MIPKLTDDAVAGLPLHHGRADLLEEIMRTPVLDDRPVRDDTDPRRRLWLTPIAAAAAVVLLTVGLWWGTSRPGDSGERLVPDDSPVAAAPADSELAVLDAPGWRVTGVYGDEYGGELNYEKEDLRFEIAWYPAKEYQGYLEDRRRIAGTPTDGESITVLGEPAQTWPYSPRDHTALRVPVAGWTLEFRGAGMGEAAYRTLLGQLRAVDPAGFEAAMPTSYVQSPERDQRVEEILAGIEEQTGTLAPQGRMLAVRSEQSDPYHLGADVAGAVACVWLDELVAATAAGDAERTQAARDALGTARQWPVLQEMEAKGGYPMVLWSFADRAVDGQGVDGYAGALGCDG